MADSSAWFALAGALGGVTLTGPLGLITASLNHRWDERARTEQQVQAAQEQRRKVSHDYLVAANSYWLTVEQLYVRAIRGEEFDRVEYMKPAISVLQDTYNYLTITCGQAVRERAHAHNLALYSARNAAAAADEGKWDELYPQTLDARKVLREAIRAELGVAD
jgi:hypothetical protein